MNADSAETSSTMPSNFIRQRIDGDLARAKSRGEKIEIVTRFPPEPNGYLHIGHAKSICLNFGLARDYRGKCHLRFDDTNPVKEDTEYINSIQTDVRWLGFDWNENMFYASDYFEKLYQYAVQLIKQGQAFVCELNDEQMREYRGTLTEPGKNSPYRDRSIEENLDLFERMRSGEFPDGSRVLRAKIDMASPNIVMRDPIIYRIRHVHHHKTGDDWCIYPMYDFAHCLSDSIEGITHSICTLEFENNRELYDWLLDALKTPCHPQQIEFARLNLNYTVMSKRKLLQLVQEKVVNGWDDPRMPTISGLRRRGYTPESIRKFCELIGVAKSNSTVDMAQLEFCIRDDLNFKAPRVLCVFDPLKVVIENYPDNLTEELDSDYYPHDVPKTGSRKLPFSKTLYIEREDFLEHPPKGYYRLSPGAEVRLRHAYIIKCEKVVKDEKTGEILELRCTYDPTTKSGEDVSGKKVSGTIHWVSAQHAVPVEVRLYDRLFSVENPDGGEGDFKTFLNPDSLEVLQNCYVEPSVVSAKPGDHFQFERQGYFFCDPVDSKPGKPVFNKTVALKDSWGKQTKPQAQPAQKPEKSSGKAEKSVAASLADATSKQKQRPEKKPVSEQLLTPEAEARIGRYQKAFGLPEEQARSLGVDAEIAAFFDAAVNHYDSAKTIANWMATELLRELKEKAIGELRFSAADFADLVKLLDNETISSKIAKIVFEEMMASGGAPEKIIDAKGLKQISDPAVLAPIIEKMIAANPDNVARFKEGKGNMLGFFVGKVMAETRGQANPQVLNELLQERLSKG